jgi:hypothetical protein
MLLCSQSQKIRDGLNLTTRMIWRTTTLSLWDCDHGKQEMIKVIALRYGWEVHDTRPVSYHAVAQGLNLYWDYLHFLNVFYHNVNDLLLHQLRYPPLEPVHTV